MLKCLHLADLHLGWYPAFLGPRAAERQRERDGFLSRAVDYALEGRNGISLVILAGDLFETHRPEPPLVEEVLRQLRRLEGGGVKVVTVPGNHDELTYPDSVYRERAGEWPGILVTNPLPRHVASLQAGGGTCHLYSLAYTGGLTPTPPPLSEFPRLEEPGWHLAVLHGSLDWDAGDRSLPILGEGLASARYHYVALGHFHRPIANRLGGTLLAYAGLAEARGFSDPGCGSLAVVSLGEGETRLERVPVACRPCRTMELNAGLYPTPEELDGALVPLADGESLLEIRLTGTANFPLDEETIAARHAHLFYHLKIVNATTSLDPELVERWCGEQTIRGYFARRLRDRQASATSERQRRVMERALLHGLAALKGGGG